MENLKKRPSSINECAMEICVMDICSKVDDVVWSKSLHVWDEVFVLILREQVRLGVLVNVVEQWINSKMTEFDNKHRKVSDILKIIGDSNEGVRKLMIHYQEITLQYKSAYDSCRSVEYVL